MKLKDDKKLSGKQNEYEISEMGHSTEMAIMNADHRALFKSPPEVIYRERHSEQNYSRAAYSHPRSQWSSGSSRSDNRSHGNRSREICDETSRDFYFVEQSHEKRSRDSAERRYYDNGQRESIREEQSRSYNQRSRDIHFDERRERRWRDDDAARSHEIRSRSDETSLREFSTSREQVSRPVDSRGRHESSRNSHDHYSAHQQRREERIDNSHSRGDSNNNDKNSPHRSSSNARTYEKRSRFDETSREFSTSHEQGSRSVDSRSHHPIFSRRSHDYHGAYKRRRDEFIVEYSDAYGPDEEYDDEEEEFGDNGEYYY